MALIILPPLQAALFSVTLYNHKQAQTGLESLLGSNFHLYSHDMKKIQNLKYSILFILLGLLVGVTGTLSFLRTRWEIFQVDFFFWWSIISTLIGLIFMAISIWQYWENQSELKKNKAQVKVWMQDANGIRSALQRIVQDNLSKRYSSTNDMGNAVWSIEATAGSLYQSLYEERCVTEEEYRARQKKLADIVEAQQFEQLKSRSNDKQNPPTLTSA